MANGFRPTDPNLIGSDIGAGFLNYTWDTNTAETDPGVGVIKGDNSDLSLITELYINEITSNGLDITSILEQVERGDVFAIVGRADQNIFLIATAITSTTDNGGWFTVPVSSTDSAGSFSDGADVIVRYLPTAQRSGIDLVTNGQIMKAIDNQLVYAGATVDGSNVWTFDNPPLGIIINPSGFDANDAIYPSSNPAGADSRNGHPIISFNDTVAENVLFNDLMRANYNGEAISIDIDWIAETATTGGVTWGIEFERNAPGGDDIDSDSFAAQQTGTSTTNGTSGIITRTTITLTQAEADAIEALDSYRMRAQRVVSDGGDDMTGDAQILAIGVR